MIESTKLQGCVCRVWEDIITGTELFGINLTERISIKKKQYLL